MPKVSREMFIYLRILKQRLHVGAKVVAVVVIHLELLFKQERDTLIAAAITTEYKNGIKMYLKINVCFCILI